MDGYIRLSLRGSRENESEPGFTANCGSNKCLHIVVFHIHRSFCQGLQWRTQEFLVLDECRFTCHAAGVQVTGDRNRCGSTFGHIHLGLSDCGVFVFRGCLKGNQNEHHRSGGLQKKTRHPCGTHTHQFGGSLWLFVQAPEPAPQKTWMCFLGMYIEVEKYVFFPPVF